MKNRENVLPIRQIMSEEHAVLSSGYSEASSPVENILSECSETVFSVEKPLSEFSEIAFPVENILFECSENVPPTEKLLSGRSDAVFYSPKFRIMLNNLMPALMTVSLLRHCTEINNTFPLHSVPDGTVICVLYGFLPTFCP
jgi:hypothetical protein